MMHAYKRYYVLVKRQKGFMSYKEIWDENSTEKERILIKQKKG
jgi:hypothetical protein